MRLTPAQITCISSDIQISELRPEHPLRAFFVSEVGMQVAVLKTSNVRKTFEDNRRSVGSGRARRAFTLARQAECERQAP